MSTGHMTGVSLYFDEDELKVNEKVAAILEASPTEGGWNFLLHLGRDAELKPLPVRGILPATKPLPNQSLIVTIHLGDHDDLLFSFSHGGIYFESPASLGVFEGLIERKPLFRPSRLRHHHPRSLHSS